MSNTRSLISITLFSMGRGEGGGDTLTPFCFWVGFFLAKFSNFLVGGSWKNLDYFDRVKDAPKDRQFSFFQSPCHIGLRWKYIPQFTLTFPVYIFYTQQRKYAAFKQRQRYEKSTRHEVVSLSLVKMVSVVCTMHFIVEYRDVGSRGQGGRRTRFWQIS